MTKIREKNACKGVAFDSDVHSEFDVLSIPYCDVHKKHPLRIAWNEANEDKDYIEDNGLEDLAVRSRDLGGRGKALSYTKLVRQTAVRMHKEGIKDATEIEAEVFITEDKTRLFQNLIAVVSFDDKTLRQSVECIDNVIDMFIADVLAEYPHAKPSASSGKSRAEIEAEIEAERQEALEVVFSEAKAFVARAATPQGVSNVRLPSEVTIEMLGKAYQEYRDTLLEKQEEGHDGIGDLIDTLDTWAIPYKALWGLPETDASVPSGEIDLKNANVVSTI